MRDVGTIYLDSTEPHGDRRFLWHCARCPARGTFTTATAEESREQLIRHASSCRGA